MPINEFRESIRLTNAVDVSAGNYALYQKKINLMPGHRNTVNFIDVIDDNALSSVISSGQAYQFYISKYPVIPTGDTFANLFDRSGPAGSDPNVLFYMYAVAPETGDTRFAEFPNQFLGSSPTFSFYQDHLYLTLILFDAAGTPEFDASGISFSVYMAVESIEVDAVEYGMGYWSEYLQAQVMFQMSQGTLMQSTMGQQAGQTFPMWRTGGLRPERMMDSNQLANWWFNLDGNFAERTATVLDLRTAYNAAKQMQTYDIAFGRDLGALGAFPDWIRLNALPSVISGPERAEFPTAIFPTAVDIAAGVNNVQVMT